MTCQFTVRFENIFLFLILKLYLHILAVQQFSTGEENMVTPTAASSPTICMAVMSYWQYSI